MSAKKNRTPSLVQSILKDTAAQDKANQEMLKIAETKAPLPQPAELDQDPGGGYNTDTTFPQE
jgi:hypothetical protein